jgi:hypothetical protein
MIQSYIVEIGEEAVGLVSREQPSQPFRFVASDARLRQLDGAPFATPRAAEAAAQLHLARARRDHSFAKTNDSRLGLRRTA